jgi:hypothetical protein
MQTFHAWCVNLANGPWLGPGRYDGLVAGWVWKTGFVGMKIFSVLKILNISP